MNIKIDETYSIKSDLRNIMLVENKITEKGKNKGKPYEDYVGYYATIENALKAYLNFRINTSQATNFKLIMDEIKDIRKTIEKALEGTNYENYTLKLKGE